LVVLVVAAAMVRLAIAWAPGEWLLRHVLADDPFYYFTIARHFAHGGGLTFDRAEPTNGVHPLWLYFITPIFGLFRDPWLAIHVTLTLAAVLDISALLLLLVLLRELEVARPIRLAVGALYAFSPLLLSLAGSLNGLETPLNVLLIVAFLLAYQRLARVPGHGGAALGLAVSSALLFLARTDNIVLLAFAFLYLLSRARSDRRAMVRLAGAALFAGCVASPWLAWSWSRFGSAIQVSGLAVARANRVMAQAAGWTWRDYAAKVGRNLATVGSYVPVGRAIGASLAVRASANIAFTASLITAWAFLARAAPSAARRDLRARLTPWVPPLMAGVAFVIVHTLRAIEMRSWYFASLVPLVLVALALISDFIARELGRRPSLVGRLVGSSALVALLVMLGSAWRKGLADRCGEIAGYAAVRAANERLPDGTRLGAWNAGLFGYFYNRGDVVNLDGLVNNAAYHHILNRSLGAYVAERHIAYLLDREGAIELAKASWNSGRPVSFRPAVWQEPTSGACYQIVLVPLSLEEP
jgi:hypothetical protein